MPFDPSPSDVLPQTMQRVRDRLQERTRTQVVHLGTASAVLIPLFLDGEEPHLWLVRKRDTLRRHAGQVALPGGKHEPGDVSLRETALREAEEEIGLPPARVHVLGEIHAYPTITGFVVTPYVGFISEPFAPVPDETEVARVFSAPLALFLETPVIREVNVPGWRGEVPCHVHDGEIIWGATFAMLQDFASHLRA